MANRETVVKALATLSVAYPASTLPPGSAELWHEVMEDIPDTLFMATVMRFVTGDVKAHNSAFCPTAGEVRNTAIEDLVDASNEMTAGEAWTEAERALLDPQKFYGMTGEAERALCAVVGDFFGMSLAIREGREKIGPLRAAFVKEFNIQRDVRRYNERMHPSVRALIHKARKELTDGAEDA